MNDLPSIDNKVPQVRAPESRVSPGQIASPYLELSHTLDTASKEAGDVAKIYAHEAGLKAVSRDEQGNIKVDRAPIVGDTAIHYQNAIKVAAVADGENVVKNDMIALRQEHRDDPASFAAAAKTYRAQKVQQYEKAAGPDVALALGKTIDNTSIETYRGLLNQKERLDITSAHRSIEAQIESASNELYALANGGDTASPEFQQRLQKVGALWGQLANNPRMAVPKERVEFEMNRLRSELDVAGLDYRIAKTQAEKGADVALAEADRVRTDPGLNLTPGQRYNYYSRLVGGITQRANMQNAADRGVAGEIKAVNKIAMDGFTVPPQRMGVLREQVAASNNPDLTRQLQDAETIQPIMAQWRTASPIQLGQSLADLDRVMREHGATEQSITLRDAGGKLLTTMRAGIKTDPLGWAERTGAVPVTPIDFAGPDVGKQMQTRIAQAETVAAHYGVPPAYLKPGERSAIQAATQQGGAPMLQAARMLVDGFGDRAPQVFSEVSKEAPVLAHLGGLMSVQGSPALLNDAAEATKWRSDPEMKKRLPNWFDKPTDKIFAAQNERTASTYGGAFLLEPETGRAAMATAQAAFSARAVRNNYDPLLTESDAKKGYERALQESAGATFIADGTQFGGIASHKPGYWTSYKVLIPGNVRNDRFGEVIDALRDEDVAGAQTGDGRKLGASAVRNAVPVAVRGGYRFAVGDPASDDPKWIAGPDGRPFLLDIDKLEPALRQRAPGAYAGR